MITIFCCIVTAILFYLNGFKDGKWYYAEKGWLNDLTPGEIEMMRKEKK